MSHVDEGALHAYLDGALDEYPAAEAQKVREHLDGCVACRERLESEREVRGEAASILGLAAPEVTVPSLEELRTYVRANTPRRSPMSVRIYRMGWAASVVLALGTGWMLRGGQVPMQPASFDEADTDVTQFAPSVEEVTAGPAGQEPPTASPAPTRAAEAARQEASSVAPATVAANQAPVAQPAEPASGTGGARPLTENAVADDAPASLDITADLDVSPALRSGDGRLDETVTTNPDRDRERSQVTALRSEPASDVATAEPPTVQEKVADAAVAGTSAEPEPERRAVPTDLVTSANAAAPATGITALGRSVEFGDAQDEVAEDEESYSLVVPNLDVIDVRFRSTGVQDEGQVVRQLLESGDTLEVIHLPREMDPSALESPSPGDSELVIQRAAGWIVMRAPLGEEALMELLERLLAGG